MAVLADEEELDDNDLNELIEKLRKKMISVGMSKGLTSQETINLSRKLDNLLNLQRLRSTVK
ncbi:aspartyl-phosphate phosphatase Spo0E family protein [Bacillus sp. EB600]|uniref:aspartyl-phosphate phosphatase Spo0E family protein n=1 Tax=Bacillus sp. EB600 TaxID=2806345 RepID=UPI00210CB917|nr:aspartyl-phosphate phosphatase Spo0E family protein [Bacillus sp. EB600]MCQ6281956.1 aspartyl-phosphate phosphatase Spo0E family protein [Bacillus sp. EB600]